LSLTRTAVRVVLSLLVVLVPLDSCTFVVGTSAYEEGCASDRKACTVGGKKICVEKKNSDYGCSSSSCTPCFREHTATYSCLPNGGGCGVGSCNMPWFDCDNVADNGCEKDLSSDPANCNACGMVCTPPTGKHVASVRCAAGSCKVDKCDANFIPTCANGTASGVLSLGCDTPASVMNCGRCGPCPVATPFCDTATWTCKVAPPDGGT
jgi:hypothetical protein